MSENGIPLVNIGKRSTSGYTQLPDSDSGGSPANGRTQDMHTSRMPTTAAAVTTSQRNGKRRINAREGGGRAGDVKGKGKGRYVDEDDEEQNLLAEGDEGSDDERPRRLSRSQSSVSGERLCAVHTY